MYSTTEKEKTFLNQNKVLTPETVKEFSDRELLEKQTIYLRNIMKSTESIKANIQFWFYFGLIGGVVLFLFILNSQR